MLKSIVTVYCHNDPGLMCYSATDHYYRNIVLLGKNNGLVRITCFSINKRKVQYIFME